MNWKLANFGFFVYILSKMSFYEKLAFRAKFDIFEMKN